MTELLVPRDLTEVTPNWLAEALRGAGASGAAGVTGYTVEAVAEGTGFMSQLYRLRLDRDAVATGLPRTVILKLPSGDPLMRSFFHRLGQNRREVMFYQRLAGGERLHVPRCFHGGIDPANGNTVLLLEDIAEARQGDSVAGCTLAEAEAAIARLAAFQAAWWDSPGLDGLDWLPVKAAESDIYEDLYAGAWESFLGKAGDGMPLRLRAVGDGLRGSVTDIKVSLSRAPVTIVHGDYRLDNCFFPTAAGPSLPVVFDWEFCVRARGTYDVATFISEAFPPQRRREVERGLLHLYHATLKEAGIQGYSLDECVEDYRLSMLEVFVFWIVTGGYCAYDGERATAYLHNSLARFDAAIADLACTELLAR